MIVKMIFTPVFALLKVLLGLVPDMSLNQSLSFDISGFLDVVVYTFIFFPLPVFLAIIGNVVFWLELQGFWAMVEWIYKKIPGVN